MQIYIIYLNYPTFTYFNLVSSSPFTPEIIGGIGYAFRPQKIFKSHAA